MELGYASKRSARARPDHGPGQGNDSCGSRLGPELKSLGRGDRAERIDGVPHQKTHGRHRPGEQVWRTRFVSDLVGGDEEKRKLWMSTSNRELKCIPMELAKKVDGLPRILAYLCVMKALGCEWH